MSYEREIVINNQQKHQ